MERRSSNIEVSAARPGRRHSAVTIIAPGEEVNAFQPYAVNTSAQMPCIPGDSRFDDFKANPRENDVVNEVLAPASHESLSLPQAFPAATATPLPANRSLAGKTANRNGVGAVGSLIATADQLRCDVLPTDGNSSRPVSASKRLRGLHILPQTPPTNPLPAQHPLNIRNGNVVVVETPRAAQFPANPSIRSKETGCVVNAAESSTVRPLVRVAAHTPAAAAGAMPRRGGTSPHAAPNSNVPNVGAAKNLTATERRGHTLSASSSRTLPRAATGGDVVFSQNGSIGAFSNPSGSTGNGVSPYVSATRRSPSFSALPPPSSTMKWTSAAHRQRPSPSVPNAASADFSDVVASSINVGRRVTVPSGSSSKWRIEPMRVPRPPSRRPQAPGAQDGKSGDDGKKICMSELPSLLLSGEASPTSSKWFTDNRNGFSDQHTDTGRETSIVIEDDATETSDVTSIFSEAQPQPQPQPQHQTRAESPPPDYGDFLKPTQRKKLAAMEMVSSPLYKKKQQPENTSTSRGGSNARQSTGVHEDANDKHPSKSRLDALRAKSEKVDGEDDGNPLGGSPRGQPEPLSTSDTSASTQSFLYFSSLEDPGRTLPLDAKLKKQNAPPRTLPTTAVASYASAPERSVGSLDDFDLTTNDALERRPSANGPANPRQRNDPTAVRVPSPVDLSSMLLRGDGNYLVASSPLLATKDRGTALKISRGGHTATEHRTNDDGDRGERGADKVSMSAADKGASWENWNFDFLLKNGTEAGEKETGETVEMSPRPDKVVGRFAASPRSPTSPRRNNKGGIRSSRTEERWYVTQSLSINQADFSFDRLPLNQQNSNVAKLRKVFESQRKPSTKDAEGDRAKSARATSPPIQTKYSVEKERDSSPVEKKLTRTVSTSSRTVAPRSEASRKASLVVDGEDRGHSAVAKTSTHAPSMEFSFERLADPVSPKRRLPVFPSVSRPPQSNSSMKAKSTPTDTSGGDFCLSFDTSADRMSPLNHRSAPSSAANAKSTGSTLPPISFAASEGGFSLAHFQNSNVSVDTVNMCDQCDF